MKKIKIISLNPFQIEFLDDIKKGEVINISELFDQDEITLNNLINKKVNQEYQNLINQQKVDLQKTFENELKIKLSDKEKEVKLTFQQQVNDLTNENSLLKKERDYIVDKTKNEQKEVFEQIIKSKDNQILNLTNEIHNVKDKLNLEHQNELIKKEDEIKLNEQKYINEKQAIVEKSKDEKNELIKEYEQKIKNKQDEIDELKRNRNLLGTKDLGNELENYCRDQIQTQLIDPIGNDGSITLSKASLKDKDEREMADFVVTFRTNNHQEYENNDFKIVLEMKTESLISKEENKKRNESHLKKLVKDATSENANVAILVTELEKNDKFLIRRRNNKEFDTDIEIFLVRPECLIYLLSILRIIYLKYCVIKEQIDFEFIQKEKILDDFNQFKNEIIENQIKNINLNIEKIIKSANDIKKQAENILSSSRVILDTHLNTIENKINNYKIENKVVKQIEKIKKNI